MAAQDVGDASLGHPDAELSELADDAEVAPAGVLSGQAADERDGLVGKRWPARATMRVGPASLHEGPVPGEDRLRPDEERSPALPRDEAGEQSDARPIRSGEARTAHLAAQHGQLVAQHQDLGILGERRPSGAP